MSYSMFGCIVTLPANRSARSFPGIPKWLGTHITVMSLFNVCISSVSYVFRFDRLFNLLLLAFVGHLENFLIWRICRGPSQCLSGVRVRAPNSMPSFLQSKPSLGQLCVRNFRNLCRDHRSVYGNRFQYGLPLLLTHLCTNERILYSIQYPPIPRIGTHLVHPVCSLRLFKN